MLHFAIDKNNIIITKEAYPYSLLSYLPRKDGEFDSGLFTVAIQKLEATEKRLSEVKVNESLLSLETECKTGDTVEMECEKNDENVIRLIHWQNEWYITDIRKDNF